VGESGCCSAPRYDAGTEATDELLGGGVLIARISAPPATSSGYRHGYWRHRYQHRLLKVLCIPRRTFGDLDPNGGVSDINARLSPQNPVARSCYAQGGENGAANDIPSVGNLLESCIVDRSGTVLGARNH
jgi:hypothetical protein